MTRAVLFRELLLMRYIKFEVPQGTGGHPETPGFGCHNIREKAEHRSVNNWARLSHLPARLKGQAGTLHGHME
jgi:hypothetical protein